MLDAEYAGLVLSFDGAAKLKTNAGSAGFVVWQLPGWTPVYAEGVYLISVTVNEAEYHGLLHGMKHVLANAGRCDLVIAGDSRIVIQQCQGLINCNSPHLQLLLGQFEELRAGFQSVRLAHVKREFNGAADYLTGLVLQGGESVVIESAKLPQLVRLNQLPVKIMKPTNDAHNNDENRDPVDTSGTTHDRGGTFGEIYDEPDKSGTTSHPVTVGMDERHQPSEDESPGQHGDQPEDAKTELAQASVFVVTTRQSSRNAISPDQPSSSPPPAPEPISGRAPASQGPVDVVQERWNRIRVHQEAKPELARMKKFLLGDLASLTEDETRSAAKSADQFVLDHRNVLRYVGGKPTDRSRGDPRLVVPLAMRADVLHLHHDDVQGGHQGVTRTFERIRAEYYWRGMFRDVEQHVRECIDYSTSKGSPPNAGPSPGNVMPEYPMQIISMDFVIPLPESRQGNTALLLSQDMFSGLVLAKAMRGTTAQEVAEAYEEVVFHRFGASSEIRHDRDPRFMSEVFTHFALMMGSQQRATLSYRPQANGQQERSVQTVVRTVRSYIEEPAQEDWEDLVGRLLFAINTSVDSTRRETPFFLMHGWDAITTMAAMLAPKPARRAEKLRAYAWRLQVQRQYEYAQAAARELQQKAKRQRADERTRAWEDLADRYKTGFEVGDAVWLYIAKVKPGLTKKLAHPWHGPFRITEKKQDFMCKLQIQGSPYRVSLWVHVSRLKPRLLSPDRPTSSPEGLDEEYDFDAALLPEDSWEPDPGSGQYEVEALRDVRWGRTRAGRRVREYLVKWQGYEDETWEPVHQLRCGRLLHEFDRSARGRARFAAMQVDDGTTADD